MSNPNLGDGASDIADSKSFGTILEGRAGLMTVAMREHDSVDVEVKNKVLYRSPTGMLLKSGSGVSVDTPGGAAGSTPAGMATEDSSEWQYRVREAVAARSTHRSKLKWR